MSLSIEEARLLSTYRAIKRAKEYPLVGDLEASILAAYLPLVADLEKIESASDEAVEAFLDGYIAGYSAARLYNSNVDPAEVLEAVEHPNSPAPQFQTGVDPATGEVRVNK